LKRGAANGNDIGNIFATEDDFLGRAVVLAARIMGYARGGEILVSAACRECTQRLGKWCFRGPRQLRIKGFEMPPSVYAVDWTAA
jgi:class 3 adenylate cyclase